MPLASWKTAISATMNTHSRVLGEERTLSDVERIDGEV